MSSEKKRRKLKNSYCVKGALKNKKVKLKKSFILYIKSKKKP